MPQIENKPQELSVKIRDRDVKMQKLATIPFSSARKRMSVIVRLDNGRTRLICKGADSAVLPRLKGGGPTVNEGTSNLLCAFFFFFCPPFQLSPFIHRFYFWINSMYKKKKSYVFLLLPLVIEHVERMAVESGLRTLVLAGRDLTQQQLDSWLNRWEEAQKVTDEEEKNRRTSELAEDIEREMEAIGATGIEDRLQNGVPQTITALREVRILLALV